MSKVADHFKINLNQNLWGLGISFGFLGMSEQYDLPTLFWLSLASSLVMVISVACTTFSYTKKYMKNRP